MEVCTLADAKTVLVLYAYQNAEANHFQVCDSTSFVTVHHLLLKLLLLISCLASDSTADDDNMAGRNRNSHGIAIEVYQDDMRSTPASTGKYIWGVSRTAHQTGNIVTFSCVMNS